MYPCNLTTAVKTYSFNFSPTYACSTLNYLCHCSISCFVIGIIKLFKHPNRTYKKYQIS